MEYVRLKDIGQIITGNTPPTSKPEYYGDYMPFIKATDIPIGVKCTLVTEQSYSKLAAEKYKKSLVPKGSTCVVTIGSIGKKMTYAHTDLFVNQAINAIVPKDSYDNEYIFYNVRCSVLPQLKKLDSGTTSGRENISKTSFSSIRIPVIKDKNVQRRIGVILSTYDSLIENNTKRIRLLEKMAENLYKEWFVRFRFPEYEKVEMENGLPKGWKVKRYEDELNVKYGKGLPTNRLTEDGFPVFGSNGQIGFYTSYMYDTPQILISCRGASSGVVNISLPKSFVTNNSLVCELTDKTESVFEYLKYYFLNTNLVQYQTGSAQPQITINNVVKLKMLVPSHEVQCAFLKKIRVIDKEVANLQNQNSLLARQRDLLLPRLMSGKLEI